ncbi:MAG: Flp pilus assembly protein CpaB [Rhodobacterales bacterium]|nr:MAG: Flp pilus assembly protein CpaB [Rhodobacterales bacterium]
MRIVFAVMLVAGLGLAAFAANLVQGYMSQQQAVLHAEREAAAQRVEVVGVVAPNRSIGYGEPITPDDVEVVGYAKPYLPEGTFGSMEEFFPQGTDVLRMAVRPMEPLEPILAVKVTAPGDDAGLVTRLGKGMRAFAIRTDVSAGVSGFLRPGDRVDVYWTGTAPGRSGEFTKLILPAMEIMAVDQTSDANLTGAMVARTVTVKADPQQVAQLAQAQTTGTLSLSLVGVGDDAVAEVVQVDQRGLLGIVEEAPEPEVVAQAPAPAPVCTVRNRRGAEIIITEVPCLD